MTVRPVSRSFDAYRLPGYGVKVLDKAPPWVRKAVRFDYAALSWNVSGQGYHGWAMPGDWIIWSGKRIAVVNNQSYLALFEEETR